MLTDYLDIIKTMPDDWDDQDGWDNYYRAYHKAGLHLEKLIIDMDLGFQVLPTAKHIRELGLRSIWLPGCGVSLAPKILAYLGAQVWASDFSVVAIEVQREIQRMTMDELVKANENLVTHPPGGPVMENPVYTVFHHDFRTAFPYQSVDCVLNVKSFQALPPKSMAAAARVHYDALRPGGHALFVTQNVQGELRDTIEDCLTSVGFHIPDYKIQKAYRARLRETGIPHIFILGRPIPDPRKHRSLLGKMKNERHARELLSIAREFEPQLRRSREEQPGATADRTAKTAHVVYNTG
jgi:SAM-dependent methyltransferase